LQYRDEIALRQRTGKDIWQSLYEPLLVEASEKEDKATILLQLEKSYNLKPGDYEVISAAANATQKLSHQKIYFSFIHLKLHNKAPLPDVVWVSEKVVQQYPFPKTVALFLTKNLSVTGNKFD
jgi:A/G-specific adenine glycosylase